ncbi:MAG: hypothetical protein LBE12_08410 [Planctomycetaceae bacterium]|jgi:hypothetical protein|nr:hypothetical protein [Planctomycetaceae bacterium]
MTVPKEFTLSDLIWFIHRYNIGYCVFGAVIEMIAFVFWIATIYISIILSALIPLPLPDGILPVLFLCVVTGTGWLNLSFFFMVQYDNHFPAIKKSLIWLPVNPGCVVFLLMVFCAAPFLTFWGISVFRQCFSYNRSRILLAWTLYQYLNHWNDWVPYPQFESQRQAIFLLYQLNLVRVSYRFGTLQVKQRNDTKI